MNWCDKCGQTVWGFIVTIHELPLPGQAGRFVFHTWCPECHTHIRSDIR